MSERRDIRRDIGGGIRLPLLDPPAAISGDAESLPERLETGSELGLDLPAADRSPSSRQGASLRGNGTGRNRSQTIRLGTTIRAGAAATEVFYESPEFGLHKDKPWLAAYIKSRYSINLSAAGRTRLPRGCFSIPSSLLGRHALLCGGSGSGKTRLALHLLREQLKAGCSAVVLDVKAETIRQALACALEAGVRPEQITVLWPQLDEQGVPGWNPFSGDSASIRQAVRQFVSLIEASTTSWGPRLQDVLTNAATVIAGQRLSLFELMRFLQNEDYREGLLEIARQTPAWEEFREEHDYFVTEFAAFPKGERGSAVGPVLNKIRFLVSVKYLRALLCAEQDTLELASLWHEQRVLLVHLDSWALGSDGTKLLAGMLSHSLFHTAMQQTGGRPVVLCLDEMRMQERFVGAAMMDILAVARSQNLRLLAACQHLDQLSDGLRSALLSNTSFRAFFRLGPEDAKRVASSLATGLGSHITKVSVDTVRRGKYDPIEFAHMRHPLVDMWDRPLRISAVAWEEFERAQALCRSDQDSTRLLGALQLLMTVAGVARVYTKVPGSGEAFEVKGYIAGISPGDISFEGPSPLKLVVRFPRPKAKVLKEHSEEERARDFARTLMQLPQRQAIVRTETGHFAQIKVMDVSFSGQLPEPSTFLSSGQTAQEISDTATRRRSDVESIAHARQTASTESMHTARSRRTTSARQFDNSSDSGSPAWQPYPLDHLLPVEPEVADDGSL